MAKEDILFELTDIALERVVFAMEDQRRTNYIDLRTGDLVPKPSGELPEWIGPPPAWTPADGFSLMEGFCAKLHQLELKLALRKTLSRGKGVFKAFREVLAEHPQEEALFKEYKYTLLRRHVEAWMDEMRESLGMARLGGEPEEFQDLLDEEFCIESQPLSALSFGLEEFIQKSLDEATAWLPPQPLVLERQELQAFLRENRDSLHVHYIPEAEGRPIALAGFAPLRLETEYLGCIRFLYVLPEFRELDLGLRLVESIVTHCRSKGIEHCIIRSALMDPRIAQGLESLGLKATSVQYLASF